MAANYPTYSNNLRTAGQQQRYNQPRNNPYGGGMQQQPPNNAWDANRYTAGTQPQYSQYGSGQARGGGQPPPRQPTYQPSPLPGQGPVDREGGMDYYNPTYPTYTPSAPAGQVQANTFRYYPGLDPTTLQSNDEREAALQSVQANVPIWQLNQNAYQYAQDANEANRRWQEQFNYQQGLDRYNMDLSGRQQQMAEWQAQQAAQQWAQDFNRNQANDRWQQQFSQQQFGLQDYSTREGLRQSDWLNQQRMANEGRGLDIQQQYQQGQLSNQGRQLDIQQQLGLGNLDIQRQQNDINAAYNAGRLSNDARQIALAELAQQQNNQLAQGRLDVERQQLGISQRAGEIDAMYKSGQLDLGRRNAALAELAQQQQYLMQQSQLGQVQTEQGRRFGLDERTQANLEVFRQQQLAQEAQLAQQQIAAQREMALLNAYGRNQAPNARWLRAS